MVVFHDHIAVPIIDILTGISAGDTVFQSLNGLLAVHEGLHHIAGDLVSVLCAIHFPNDQFLGYIHHTAGQITGVRRTQRGIRHTLPGAMSGHKVLQYVQPLTEIGLNRQFNGLTGGVRHQTAHTRQLLNLLIGTTGAGVRHHKDIIILIQTGQQHIGKFLIRLVPGLHHRTISLLFGDQTPAVVGCDLIHGGLCRRQHLRLLSRHGHIGNGYGHGGPGGILIADGFHIVQHLSGTGSPMGVDDLLQNLLKLLLTHMEIHLRLQIIFRGIPLHKAQILGQYLVEQEASQRGLHIAAHRLPLGGFLGHPYLDPGVQGNELVLIGQYGLVYILKELAFAQYTRPLLGKVVDAQHHILGRHCHRPAVRGLQQIVGRQQQEAALCLSLHGQRQMHCHLVAVKVRIEGRTYQRMQLDGLALHQYGLKSLYAQPVQSRSAVQHHGMLLDYLFQHIEHLGVHSFHQLFGVLDILTDALGHQFLHHKGFEQFNGHLLGQTALINLQFRAHHDNGTAGIVHTFTQQILTETPSLTFEHIGQGFQRPVAGPGDGTAPSAVVNKRVHSLLQHALLVAHNDIRSTQFQQPLQSVVPVYNSPVQVV